MRISSPLRDETSNLLVKLTIDYLVDYLDLLSLHLHAKSLRGAAFVPSMKRQLVYLTRSY